MVASAVGGGLLLRRMVANIYRPFPTRHRVVMEGLEQSLRVVGMSDLHLGPYLQAGSLSVWVELANTQRPDLIVITGDFADKLSFRPLETLSRELARLHAPLGVWGVWGNHDHSRFRKLKRLRRALEQAGVRLLVNEGVMVRRDLFLAGVEDVKTSSPDLGAALRDLPNGVASLLLSHNPDLLPEVPRWVGLTLCGHTHGGQVRLPGFGAVATSSRYGQRFAKGWVQAPARAYVSRGLGVTLLPLRLNCPAELTVLELVPAQPSQRTSP